MTGYPNPQGLTWEQWCAFVDETSHGFLPSVDEDNWRLYGHHICDQADFSSRSAIPLPEFFTDWRSWAERLVDIGGNGP